jgi:hypothetical protein
LKIVYSEFRNILFADAMLGEFFSVVRNLSEGFLSLRSQTFFEVGPEPILAPGLPVYIST